MSDPPFRQEPLSRLSGSNITEPGHRALFAILEEFPKHMMMMIKNGYMTSWSIRILLLLLNLVRLVPWGDFLSYFLRCRKWKWIRKQRFSIQTTQLRLVPCRQWWPRASVPTARDPSQPPRRGRCTSSRSPEKKLLRASAKNELCSMFCCSGARLCFPVWRLWNQVCLEEESCKTQSQVLF